MKLGFANAEVLQHLQAINLVVGGIFGGKSSKGAPTPPAPPKDVNDAQRILSGIMSKK